MEGSFYGAKRGGFIFTATLLLFLAVALVSRAILSALNASDVVSYTVNSVLTFAVFIVVVGLSAKKSIKTVYIRKCAYVHLFSAVLLAFGMLLGLGFVNLIVSDGVKSLGGTISEPQIPLDNAFQFVLFSVVLCLLPAIGEELFFRGVMAESLSKAGKVSGVFTVALCFALYHGNAAQLIYQFVYGLGLGVLALKARSVVPTIVAHFINNFAVLAIEYFKIPLDLFSPITISVGAVLLIIFAVIMFVPRYNLTSSNAERESIKEFYIPFGLIGVLAAALMVILSALPI